MEEIPNPSPLVTAYTKELGIPEALLDKLSIVRQLDPESEIKLDFGSWMRTHLRTTSEPIDIRHYQRQMTVHLSRMKRFICGDAVGLGKTLDSIAACCWLKHRLPKTKIVVLATKSTTYQWYDEVRDFSELRPIVMQDKAKGLTSYNARYRQLIDFFEQDKHDVMIVKYTSMKGKRKKLEGQFDEDGNVVTNKREAISQEIKTFRQIFKQHASNIVLICDEAHKFKTPGSQVRNLVWNLQKSSGRVWALTATAIKNNLEEFYSIAVAIGLEPLGGMGEFYEEFCNYGDVYIGQGRMKPVLLGYKRIPEFRNAMRPFFLGRSQAQVKEPLPRLTTVYHNIDLDEETAKILLDDIPSGAFDIPPIIYKEAGQIFERERKPDNLMTMMSLYQMIANHIALLYAHTDPAKFFTSKLSPKEEALLDLIDGDFRGEKCIVFAQPLTARVLTPSGWRNMGDLKIGDSVVDPDGGVGLVEGIYPQGSQPVFRVETKSCARTEVTEDHLWLTQSRQNRHDRIWKIRTTAKMMKHGFTSKKNRYGGSYNKYCLPLPQAVTFDCNEVLPIPPYTLGVLLGDGDIKKGVGFGVADFEIVERVRQECIPGMLLKIRDDVGHSGEPFFSVGLIAKNKPLRQNVGGNNPYLQALRKLGLSGKDCYTKFIPEMYKKASPADRLALLRGYMDTDGGCPEYCPQPNFSTASRQLAEDFSEIVRSLGGLAYLHDAPNDGVSWRISVSMNINPFCLKRKAENWHKTDLLNPLKKATPVGEKECQCIRVSTKRHLYITDDFIVTHNTKYKTWIDRLEEITKRGQFTERKFLRITGDESEKQRAVAKRLFQDPKGDHDLIVVNSAAMEGVNLQQAAHELLLDVPWSWGDLLQLVGRMVRMASPHSACQLHVFTAKGTVDEYAVETLKGKKGVFDKILGESHSAGILDEKEAYDLTSGLDKCGSDGEFVNMLRIHAKKIGLSKFVRGEKLAQAQMDAGYALAFETEPKNKLKNLTFDDKWNFEEL
jgi:superfamily II DNA or RNA helicase